MATYISAANTAALVALWVLSTVPVAGAGGRTSWFESLRIPGTSASCCDLSDCHKTEADWRADHWWAVVNEKWRLIPMSSVITQPASIDGSAYVCAGSPTWRISGFGGDAPILCFVPPNLPS